VKSKFDKDEGCNWMCYQYTIAATFIYYLDYAFDIYNGVFLVWPQDILHYFLFVATLPIRLLGVCLDKFYYQSKKVRIRHLAFEDKDLNCMSRFGVMLQKQKDYSMGVTHLREEKNKGIWEWNRMHFCMVNIRVERWDSLKTYADISLLTVIAYFWFHALCALKSDDGDQFLSFRRVYDTTGYDIDMSDMTFVCLWPFLRIFLQMTRRFYLLSSFVNYRNADVNREEKEWNLVQLLFGWRLRPPTESLYDIYAVDYEDSFSNKMEVIRDIDFSMMLNQAMANYELALIRFFCTEDTYLKFRRNHRDWATIDSNHMSLHKDMICLILALAVSLVYDFLEEPQYVLEYHTLETCDLKQGRCTGDEVLNHCWCAVNLIWDIPTLLAFIAGTVIAVIGSMRAVMVVIFGLWLQQKTAHTTWCVTAYAGGSETRSDWRYPMVLPDTASISVAFFGYAKIKNWREKICQMKEDSNFLTMKDIREIFSLEGLFNVTHDIKYYLHQGTTSFRVVEKEIDQEPILLVKGEWRGGLCGPQSKANKRNRHDAIQIVNVMHTKDHGHLDWQRKQVTRSEVSISDHEPQAGKRVKNCRTIESKLEMTKIIYN